MAEILAWRGDAPSLLALADRAGRPVQAHLVPGLAPDFVLEDQAAALGLRTTSAPATATPRAEARAHERLVESGHRAVIAACRPPLGPAFLGRVLDAQALADARGAGGEGAFEVVVFDGPLFRRRVDLVAHEPLKTDGGWRLALGLRGC